MPRSTSRHVHPGDFFLLADEFSRPALLDMLGIDRTTLRRWRDGDARIPWAAYQLLRECSRYGRAERDSAEGFNREMIRMQVDALQRRVAELEAELRRQARLIDWGCANDPFIDPRDPRSVIRL